jgi:lipopolysaccharide assembly protein A
VADHDPTKTSRAQDRSWKLWAGLVALLVLIIFVVQNSQEVTVDFLFTTTTTPLIFALVFVGVLGGLVGWLLPRVRRGGRHRQD